jgi:hypothetical protein
MKTTRRTEIVFERDRTIVYAGRYPQRRGWCEACRAGVQMITVFEAAKLAAVSTYTIHSIVDDGQVHRWTTAEGILVVCLNSLSL